MTYKAPFPYFGGKSTIAADIWKRFGPDVSNYVEPFAGSMAVLLARPNWTPEQRATETVNDANGFVSNFWRALKHAPDEVAFHADWPVNENDLHARHAWLVREHIETLGPRLEGDPEYYDVKVAGWWVWGMCCWIGSGFCSGNGPWQAIGGQLVHLGDAGMGVNRQLVHLGNAGMGEAGTGEQGLYAWMQALAERIERVRVCSGDWSRVMGPSVTEKHGTCSVFLDPPYSDEAGRVMGLYATDDGSVAHDVRRWAIEHGDNQQFRIALCGYDSEHGKHMPDGWEAWAWKAHGGFGSQGSGAGRDNAMREVIWFSPHCLNVERTIQAGLFA